MKKHFLVAALLLVILLSLAICANLWKESRRIEEVVVEGNRLIAARDVRELARVPVNTLLFDLDLFEIEQRVAKNEYVKSAAVHRDIPGRVRITIEEREPFAAMLRDGRLWYLDADGIVLPPAKLPIAVDVPVLGGTLTNGELLPGKRTKNRTVLDALALLTIAKDVDEDVYNNISEIRIDGGNDLLFYTAESGVPVIVGRNNIGTKLVKFDAFWRAVVPKEGAEQLRYIDLRYDDQVVVRKTAGASQDRRSKQNHSAGRRPGTGDFHSQEG